MICHWPGIRYFHFYNRLSAHANAVDPLIAVELDALLLPVAFCPIAPSHRQCDMRCFDSWPLIYRFAIFCSHSRQPLPTPPYIDNRTFQYKCASCTNIAPAAFL